MKKDKNTGKLPTPENNGTNSTESTSNEKKSNSFKKQLVSGGVYIALAAAIVTVTMGSVSRIMNGDMGYTAPDVNIDGISHTDTLPDNKTVVLPNIIPNTTPHTDKEVSGTKKGVDANISQPPQKADSPDNSKETNTSEKSNAVEPPTTANDNSSSDAPPLPSDDDAGEDTSASTGDTSDNVTDTPLTEYPQEPAEEIFDGRFYKVADGYINREYSVDELIYSPTMKDFRTHNGIDITADPSSPVRLFSDAVIVNIYNDPLMGITVVADHGGGIVAYYSNLSEDLPKSTAVGASLSGGSVIAGVGNTAASECADVSHVHLSITRNGVYINPEEYLTAK